MVSALTMETRLTQTPNGFMTNMSMRAILLLVILSTWIAVAQSHSRPTLLSGPPATSLAFLSSHTLASTSSQRMEASTIVALRGGAEEESDDDSDDEDSDDEAEEAEGTTENSEDESEDEEEVVAAPVKTRKKQKPAVLDAKLAASALKKEATSKVTASKQAVNAKLASQSVKKKKKMGLRLPYIVRACLNPITVVKMTIAYWQSLFQLDYGKQDSSQDLRSALQTKARTQGGGGGGGRKTTGKSRRGRATTINDLPRLNT